MRAPKAVTTSVFTIVVLACGAALAAWALMIRMPGDAAPGETQTLTPAQRKTAAHLADHVHTLAGDIGQRNIWHPEQLAAAAAYIEGTLTDFGWTVHSERYSAHGVGVRNLLATLPGTDESGAIVLAGAHYDSVRGSPGADDNASGVAALLELARRFAGQPGERTLRLVAFVNEEAPFFLHEEMGSRHHAAAAAARGEDIRAMFSLEMLGYYDAAPGSQHYPFPFSWFYPDTADFIAFVGNLGSRRLVRRSVAAFRARGAIESHGVAAPDFVPGVGWSDHAAFWSHGYPAVMVTDTSFYRYPHYHRPTDTPERLDYDRMSRVVDGLETVLRELIGGRRTALPKTGR